MTAVAALRIGDRVYVSNDGNPSNFSGEGRVIRLDPRWVTVAPLNPVVFQWNSPTAFPRQRVSLVGAHSSREVFIALEEYEYEQRVTNETTGGQKGQKLARFGLIPAIALRALARHYGIGAIKYDDSNWARGYDWDLSVDALERHFNAWRRGESVYLEEFEKDGVQYKIETHHLVAVAWQAFTLYVFEKLGLGTDTRILKDS